MTLTKMTISSYVTVFINIAKLLSSSECKSTSRKAAAAADVAEIVVVAAAAVVPLVRTVGNFPAWFYDLIQSSSVN